MNPTQTLVLYHGGNCADGWMAAYLAYLALGKENVTYQAVNYQEPVPDLTGKIVYILDFSYPPEKLLKAAKTAISVELLDHHVSANHAWFDEMKKDESLIKHSGSKYSAADDLLTVTGMKFELVFDLTRSGAGLALEKWDKQIADRLLRGVIDTSGPINRNVHAFSVRLKALVNAVEDRDLWTKILPYTEEICAALTLLPKTFEAYNHYIQNTPTQVTIEDGRTVLEHSKVIWKAIASRAHTAMFLDWMVPVVNCNKQFASEVGNILAVNKPFSLSYEMIRDKLVVSLRSTDMGEDVSVLAQKFGGGGHRNAAGFIVPAEKFADLITFPSANI